jgi:hypothetical protein
MIHPDEMIPIELCVLKCCCGQMPISPRAMYSQWIEIHEPMAWAFKKAHALANGTQLSGHIVLRRSMSD